MFIPGSISGLLRRADLPEIEESVWYPDGGPLSPVAVSDSTDIGVNLGVMFSTSVEGYILAVCYWRWSDLQDPNGTIALWIVDNEATTAPVLVVSQDFVGHSGTGWQRVDFDEPIRVSAGHSYKATIWLPESSDGNIYYGSTRFYFYTTYYSPNHLITAYPNNGRPFPPHGVWMHNGWYKYGAFDCPNEVVDSSNYWIDVVLLGNPRPNPPDPPIVLKWPIPAGYPNLSNTGIPPGTVLTPVYGELGSTADGQIFENLDVTDGGINISHHNCIIRRCKIYYRGARCIGINFGCLGTIIEDCDLNSGFKSNPKACGVGGSPLILRRCNIYRGENGVAHYGSYGDGSVTQIFEDNFIHHLRASPDEPHYDCMQFNGGQANIIIRHNTLNNENTDTSTILIENLFGPVTNIQIEDNLMFGGGFTSYCMSRTEDIGVDPVIVQYHNNQLRCGANGYIIDNRTTPDMRGNQFMDHGEIYDAAPPGGFTEGQIVRERFVGMPLGVAVVPGSIVSDAVPGLTLGISFQVAQDTDIVGVNIPKIRTGGETITYKIGVWRFIGANLSGGQELLYKISINFTSGSREGWEHLPFDMPVSVEAGDNILLGVWMSPGADGRIWFTVIGGVFGDNVVSQFGRATAFNGAGVPYNGFTGGNGLFNYGPDLAPPLNQTGGRPSYNIDPIFEAPWETVADEPPTATNLSVSETYTEDTPLNLIDIVVADADSPNVTVTMTLSNPSAGSLSTATSGSVTSTYTAGVWTASGPIANVNTLLAGVVFTPTASFDSDFTIATNVSDGEFSIAGTKAFTSIPVNDPPTATNLSAAEAYTEDTPVNLTNIVVTDIDSPNVTARLTLSNPAAGSLSTATSGSVTSTYVAGTGVWTAAGAIANVNTLLAGVIFTPAANFNSNFSIATSVSDGVAAAITGTKAFTGTAVADAPTATNLSAAETYNEDTPLNLINIVVTDVDSPNVTVTLTLSNPAAGSLSTATAGSVTSTYNAGTGVWTASGPTANVNTLLVNLVFTPTTDFNSNFTVATSVSDGTLSTTGTKAFTGVPATTPGTIPLTYGDSRFASNTDSFSVTISSGTLLRKSITDTGGIASIIAEGNVIIDTCRVNSRECVRMAGNVVDIRNSYLEATGAGDDHADVIQAYDPGQLSGVITVTDTSIVGHNTAANAGLFVADYWGGTVTLQNVVFNGGPYGLKLHADTGVTLTISLKDVFFVGPFMFGPYLIGEFGGTANVIKWENVRNATIVGGVLIPGSIIPAP